MDGKTDVVQRPIVVMHGAPGEQFKNSSQVTGPGADDRIVLADVVKTDEIVGDWGRHGERAR